MLEIVGYWVEAVTSCLRGRWPVLAHVIVALCFGLSAVTGSLSSFAHAHAHGIQVSGDAAEHDHDDDHHTTVSAQTLLSALVAFEITPDSMGQPVHDIAHEHSGTTTPLLTPPVTVAWEARIAKSCYVYDAVSLTGITATMLERPPKFI